MWTPQIFGPKRENHIMRSTSMVNHVVYEKNQISYSTFDAPSQTVDVIRLSFTPVSVKADAAPLSAKTGLNQNGYTLQPLPDGDYILTVRHDDATQILIQGKDDPQKQIDDSQLGFKGDWKTVSAENASQKSLHSSEQKDDSMEYSFVGNQIRVFGNVGPDGGLADVYIDGQKQLTLLDGWNPQVRSKQLLYYKNGMKNTEHTLKIVMQGKSNPLSKGTSSNTPRRS